MAGFEWLNTSATEAAKRLLGCEIISTTAGAMVRVRIVETEAYSEDDEASHAYRGQTARNFAMFLGAGHMYVYLSYGIHDCMNVVCGEPGYGSGVLIRAVEPIVGINTIMERRGLSGFNVTNGPGKVCQALGVNTSMTGHFLDQAPVVLKEVPPVKSSSIITTTRIGISKAANHPKRFYIKDNPFVSHPIKL